VSPLGGYASLFLATISVRATAVSTEWSFAAYWRRRGEGPFGERSQAPVPAGGAGGVVMVWSPGMGALVHSATL